MNSKLIAIIAVVAMCGAALVGVGYAYQASYQTADNTAEVKVNYITVGATETDSVELSAYAKYDTTAKANGDKTATIADVVGTSTNSEKTTYHLTVGKTGDDAETKNSFKLKINIANVSSSMDLPKDVVLYYKVDSGAVTEIDLGADSALIGISGTCAVEIGLKARSDATAFDVTGEFGESGDLNSLASGTFNITFTVVDA